MGMKRLSDLHIAPNYDHSNYGQLQILSDQVNELILPRHTNFNFDISCMLIHANLMLSTEYND
jgi:hypothetical protein